MINILQDIQGFSDNLLVVPFTLDTTKLGDKPVKVEAIAKIGDTFAPLPAGNVYIAPEGRGAEQPIETIKVAQFSSLFMVKADMQTYAIKELHIRVYNDNMSSLSQKITISREESLDFALKPIELDFRPKSLRVHDNVKCTLNNNICDFSKGNFDIQILICNNATSQHPTWEDVTDSYLNGEDLTFKNNVKDEGTVWSVSLRYKVQKTNPNSTVMVSDIVIDVL